MKCCLCKYINSVNEAIRHTNGTTVFTAEWHRRNLRGNERLCSEHKNPDTYNTDLYKINHAVSTTELHYIPLDQLRPMMVIWKPRAERS